MWSLISLTAAFIDLTVAYFFLSASALAFFASKFLNIFGLDLPCPCQWLSFFDIHGGSFCLKMLLVDFPAQKVSDVLLCVRQAYPFNGCSYTTASNSSGAIAVDDSSSSGNLIVRSEKYDVKKGKGIVLSPRIRTRLRASRKRVRERASLAALYVELEKERSASATAADEAMSMILRLQEEKAVVEMESRQYQRMIEEKSAHDAEEMSILREILVRREREKLFLEKEVEAYRRMIALDDDDDEKLFSWDALDKGERSISRGPEERVEGSESSSPEEKIIMTCHGIELSKPYEDKRASSSHVLREKDYVPIEAFVMESFDTVANNARSSERSTSETTNDVLHLPPTRPSTLSLLAELRRSCSMSRSDNEMLDTDPEVERLVEKLKLAREDRGKPISLSIQEQRDLRTRSLDDIEEKVRESDSRTVTSQALSKKRRCRSVSSGLWTTSKGSLNPWDH